MEPPAARECVGLADDLPACLRDLRFDRVELDSVHHDEWIGRPHGRVLREAAAQAPILEARVVGSVILESPAEHLLIEFPGPAHIGRTELDVVDPPVLVALRHPTSLCRERRSAQTITARPATSRTVPVIQSVSSELPVTTATFRARRRARAHAARTILELPV